MSMMSYLRLYGGKLRLCDKTDQTAEDRDRFCLRGTSVSTLSLLAVSRHRVCDSLTCVWLGPKVQANDLRLLPNGGQVSRLFCCTDSERSCAKLRPEAHWQKVKKEEKKKH